MTKRTRISGDALTSIGFEVVEVNEVYHIWCDSAVVIYYLEDNTIEITQEGNIIDLEREWEYIDQITTLLEGLTGKTQFRK